MNERTNERMPVQEDSGTSPLITPFGVHCLEKLGDALLKNGKITRSHLTPFCLGSGEWGVVREGSYMACGLGNDS